MSKPKTEEIHKEIEIIQNVINRMSDNSFKVKAWFIGILTLILGLKKNIFTTGYIHSHLYYIIFIYLLILLFWYMDSFFLQTELTYRNIYNWVINNRKKTKKYLYDLDTLEREWNAKSKIINKPSLFKVAWSKTIWPFYFIPILFITIIVIKIIL